MLRTAATQRGSMLWLRSTRPYNRNRLDCCCVSIPKVDVVSLPFSSPDPLLSGLPDWSEVQAECRRLHLGVSPSELHGGLSGWLSGGQQTPAHWLQAVLADDSPITVPEDSPLEQLFQATLSQLRTPDFGFNLLLPAGEASLWERSQALFAWCRGFVGGFGLALGDRQVLSEEGQDGLADLVRLSAEEGQVEGDEEDELALMELEEFVRVVALLLHAEHVPALPPAKRSLH